MRRFLQASVAGTIAIVAVAGLLKASNIPLITGPIEPANLVGHINGLTQRINFGVSGILASLTTAYTTSTTSAETILTDTLPPNQLGNGQTLHYWATGINSADTNVKTVTFNYGAASCAIIVTASGAKWIAEAWVTVNGAATEALACSGQQGTTNITVGQGTGTVNNAAAVTATITLTAATSGTVEAFQAWMDQIK